MKLKDEHVGEEGKGLWLRFSQEDEQEQILVEYEGCSTTENKCTGPVLKSTALQYLRDYRAGKKVPEMCYSHSRDRDALAEIVAERTRLQLSASSQTQTGNKQKDGGGSGAGRHAVVSARTAEVVNAIATRWKTVSGNGMPYESQRAKITAGVTRSLYQHRD